ncbi:hypothetical protein CO2235_U1020014 [Cupriavidus oxalaticus]|uniref:Uncharacterized protein n=1 Tax=Cupriavidus oxalaticus TaxID=96344 RepID=A0A375FJ62_9BURK|nr:hypothetical protein CO2235_U1020014 [Cupriavidus oxalaticus]
MASVRHLSSLPACWRCVLASMPNAVRWNKSPHRLLRTITCNGKQAVSRRFCSSPQPAPGNGLKAYLPAPPPHFHNGQHDGRIKQYYDLPLHILTASQGATD